MEFYNNIDQTKVKMKRILADWQALFPDFLLISTRKKWAGVVCLNPPVLKVIGFEFDTSSPYDINICISNLCHDNRGGNSLIGKEYVEEKKHYLMIQRGGKKYINYKYSYKCLMDKCCKLGVDFYKPLSVTQVFDIYSNSPYLCTDSAEDPALVAAWAGMDNLAKEYADWAEEYYRKECEKCRCTIGEYMFDEKYSTIEEWRADFNARLADRAGLQRNYEESIRRLKYENVPVQELLRM